MESSSSGQHAPELVSSLKANSSSKRVWKVKSCHEASTSLRDNEKKESTIDNDVIHIGMNTMVIQAKFKASFVIGDRVNAAIPEAPKAEDQVMEEAKDDSKYKRPRWCPPGLTRTQRRKLPRLSLKEMRECELEKQRAEVFNAMKSMVLHKKEWKHKTIEDTAA